MKYIIIFLFALPTLSWGETYPIHLDRSTSDEVATAFSVTFSKQFNKYRQNEKLL